jgi:hypothetical protein
MLNHIVDKCKGVTPQAKKRWAIVESRKRNTPPSPSPRSKQTTPQHARLSTTPTRSSKKRQQEQFNLDLAFLFYVVGLVISVGPKHVLRQFVFRSTCRSSRFCHASTSPTVFYQRRPRTSRRKWKPPSRAKDSSPLLPMGGQILARITS